MAIASKLILDALRVLEIKTHFTEILIIVALTGNNNCTNFNRWGIFVSKKVKFEVLFTRQLIFYGKKTKQNNFRVFEEFVFFDLRISGFRFLVSDSGFWVLGLPHL